MSESDQFPWGKMNWTDFSVGKTIRRVGPTDLPKPGARSSQRFIETLAEFQRKLLPGDELYHYRSLKEEWDKGMGSEGYAIVRDGEVIADMMLKMN